VTIEFQPGAMLLASLTTDGQGAFSRDVQIPPMTTDGTKLIVVKSIGTNGRFDGTSVTLEVSGAPATARLSDDTLVPSQSFRVEGSRFAANTEIAVVLYPEGKNLGPVRSGSDGRLSAAVRMPELLLNGRHGFIVAGVAAIGKVAVVKLYATVTGGVGGVTGDPFEGAVDPFVSTPAGPTSTSPPRSTTTSPAPRYSAGPSDDGLGLLWLVVLALLLAVLVVLVVTWLRSSSGRAWSRERELRRRHRRT
jgi:hypothetical protein